MSFHIIRLPRNLQNCMKLYNYKNNLREIVQVGLDNYDIERALTILSPQKIDINVNAQKGIRLYEMTYILVSSQLHYTRMLGNARFCTTEA